MAEVLFPPTSCPLSRPSCRAVPGRQTAVRQRASQLRVLPGGGGRRTSAPTTALAGVHRRAGPPRPRGPLGEHCGGDVEQSSHRGGVVPPLGTGTGLGNRGSVGGDRTPPAGAGRHHAGPLRAATRSVDPGRCSRVREKTLWRMLYETAARANEILALNVEDLDLGSQEGCGQGQRRPPPRSGVGFWNRPAPAPLSGWPAAGTGVRHPSPSQRGVGAPGCVS